MIFKKNRGFTLIEVLISIAIFSIVGGGLYFAYSNILDIIIAAEINSTALTVISNELETIRNVDYQDIGTLGGVPAGILPQIKNINFSGFNFVLNTTIRNIDDPFDGVLGGVPNDTAPADYKIAELELSCTNCPRYIPIKSTATFSPANIEGSTKNGNLFISVIDASGQPIPQANVSVVNTSVNPAININDVTNNSGQLQLVDIATSSLGYQIIATKTGYSTERTYLPGDPPNPNPVKPHSTVVSQQVTLVTFAIDRFSTQTLITRDKFCGAISSIDFNQQGSKLIGAGPDVFKYSVSGVTNASGQNSNSSIEWDNYSLSNTDLAYDLAGTSLLSPFNVNPNTNYNINWLMEPKTTHALLVSVLDGAGQPIIGASMSLSRTGYYQSKIAGHDYFDQTDWASGQYANKSSNIETDNPSGQVGLVDLGGGKYSSTSIEFMESSTFDLGMSADFYSISWNPLSQPAQVGVDSLKFQLASNNDNATWNYIGPDGTASTYYSVPGPPIFSSHNGNRYFRYKAYFSTADEAFTPTMEDVSFEYSSDCLSSFQAFFPSLSNNTYTLRIEKAGYQTYSVPINVVSGWQEHRAVLVP